MNSLKDKSVAYWQDRLSKFFPTSPGPTYTESDMFIAGYHQALIDQAEQSKTELGNNVEKAAEDYINNQFVDSWPHGNDPEMAFIAGAKWYKNNSNKIETLNRRDYFALHIYANLTKLSARDVYMGDTELAVKCADALIETLDSKGAKCND